MRLIERVRSMQALARQWMRHGRPVAFVPTMGYLHPGHMSLVARARREVGAEGRVVLSLYVNPTQFGPKEDFRQYPRDLPKDRRLCRAAGVDVLFAPTDREMYPQDHGLPASTFVTEECLSQGMEGASRPGHFRGVTTVVAKLFLIVQPDVAIFGAKDFQQAAVIKKMTRDLHFPVRLVVAPTLRESDGLAMSSRNAYLSPSERAQAVVLSRALATARRRVRQAVRPLRSRDLITALRREIEERPDARVDYVAFFHPVTLQPCPQVTRGTQLALAVRIGRTRLIDNGLL
jgi:pantoate--beta-alanine ligase